jgi:hypothetical protein
VYILYYILQIIRCFTSDKSTCPLAADIVRVMFFFGGFKEIRRHSNDQAGKATAKGQMGKRRGTVANRRTPDVFFKCP